MTQPASTADLESEFKEAIRHYRSFWEPVDTELYDLCRRLPSHRTFAQVYAKVVVIGRVYRAGLARVPKRGKDTETEIARTLVAHASLIEQTLEKLKGQPLAQQSLVEIIQLHGQITRALAPSAGDRWLTSFVSKYLHFHYSFVPIYDSRAAKNVSKFVNRHALDRLRAAVAKPAVGIKAYYRFATAFLALCERTAAETSLEPSVKETDHLLLGVADPAIPEPAAQQDGQLHR